MLGSTKCTFTRRAAVLVNRKTFLSSALQRKNNTGKKILNLDDLFDSNHIHLTFRQSIIISSDGRNRLSNKKQFKELVGKFHIKKPTEFYSKQIEELPVSCKQSLQI